MRDCRGGDRARGTDAPRTDTFCGTCCPRPAQGLGGRERGRQVEVEPQERGGRMFPSVCFSQYQSRE